MARKTIALTRKSDQERHVRPQTFIKNTILARLSLPDLAAIGPFLEPVLLRERQVLQESKKPLEYIHFIESGLVSLRIVAEGSLLETALIGFRGAVGASFLLGGHCSTHQAVVLFPGSAHRIRVEDLRKLMDERPDIREQLSGYVQALSLHCAQMALCGVRHDRRKRIASWLCLASDASGSHVLPTTHDYLSSVLGLRRAGVTETLNNFESKALIRKARRILQIDDRKHLEQRACCCYMLISNGYAAMDRAIPTAAPAVQ
ncbi:Crp/Fnr family transcriptional regulator [Bradyrhizobium sp. CCBAU 53421]|uniref:Crp/Fnr family transcriptional regulator n=1 Tax=Bradyrhizobium sp. CCBAU 53421 TaxID=1325120 RepID=UPI00188A4217|nr:Crp/Fnr family transcriptional regulator [Bradyrhizobium sp. CCBAU 53421]QOZ36535.1 Crp/Fnr family transcriptional regulator [Bradyrhizobium sp. CCBAU 53421]